VRGLLAVLVTWFVLIAYTIYLYNPAGIAAGYEQGIDFPANHYDNNTAAVMLMAGWVLPLLSVLVAAMVRSASRMLVARSQAGRPGSDD
jgi:hypothetical protein